MCVCVCVRACVCACVRACACLCARVQHTQHTPSLLPLPRAAQPDMDELVTRMGKICDCTTGPAGAVSGYLAFGSSMD